MSSGNENLPPHQLLASDDYWANALPINSVPGRVNFLDYSFNDFTSVARRLAAVLDKCAQYDFSRQAVEQGSELPVLGPYEPGIVRVVSAERNIYRRRRLPFGRPVGRDAETFDAIATAMDEQMIYSGPTARYCFDVADGKTLSVIRKSVRYYRSSASGQQLQGLASEQIYDRRFGGTLITPPEVVGQPYVSQNGRYATRILSADILTPQDTGRRQRRVHETAERLKGLVSLTTPVTQPVFSY